MASPLRFVRPKRAGCTMPGGDFFLRGSDSAFLYFEDDSKCYTVPRKITGNSLVKRFEMIALPPNELEGRPSDHAEGHRKGDYKDPARELTARTEPV